MIPVLSVVLYFLKDTLLSVCLYFCGRFVFAYPEKARRILTGGLFLLLACNAAALLFADFDKTDLRGLTDAASFVLCCAAALSFFERPLSKTVAVAAAALVFSFTAETLYSQVSPIGEDALIFDAAFFAALFAVFAFFLYVAARKRNLTLLQGAFRSVPKWIWAVLLFFEFTGYYRTFGAAEAWYRVFSAVSVVSVIAGLLFLIGKILSFAQQQTEILRQLSVQKEYAETLIHSDEALRAFRHDYKNHLIVIDAYLENGDLKGAKSYLDGVATLSAEGMRRVSTGNFAADAVLNYKFAYADRQGIRTRFEGHIPEKGIRDEDLCTILANLLDNAIEACEALEGERAVEVEAVCGKGSFLLSVTNSVFGAVPAVKDGALPQTAKADKKNHGYGLKNVRKTARKYNGALTLETTENTFCATVRLQPAG
ncbi:MAG: sensor histidine kinase [Clostridia bacterium]|nr:sensor histidine kinase [Clostridia bacterium]